MQTIKWQSVVALTREDFTLNPLPLHPTLITDGLADWPAVTRWSPAQLRRVAAGRRVQVMVSRSGEFKFDHDWSATDPKNQYVVDNVPFEKMLDWISDGTPGAPKCYVPQISLPELLPELEADLRFPEVVSPESVRFWCGSAGTVAPLHWDTVNNLFAQIHGSKQFTLFAPDEMSRLYPFPEDAKSHRLSQVDVGNPDFERCPLYRDATPITVTVLPGQLLFLPAFWWHHVRAVTVSISANRWWPPEVLQHSAPNAFRAMRSSYTRDPEAVRKTLGVSSDALVPFLRPMLALNASAALVMTALVIEDCLHTGRTTERELFGGAALRDQWAALLACALDDDRALDGSPFNQAARWCVLRICDRLAEIQHRSPRTMLHGVHQHAEASV